MMIIMHNACKYNACIKLEVMMLQFITGYRDCVNSNDYNSSRSNDRKIT